MNNCPEKLFEDKMKPFEGVMEGIPASLQQHYCVQGHEDKIVKEISDEKLEGTGI